MEEHRAELMPPGGVPKPCKGLLEVPSQRDPDHWWASPCGGLESPSLSGSAMVWGRFQNSSLEWPLLPQHKAPSLLPGPCCSSCLTRHPHLKNGKRTPAEMDIGGQAPQTDGHGRKALPGLPLTQPGRWGLLWKEGTLSLSPGQSPVSHFPTSGSQTEKVPGSAG